MPNRLMASDNEHCFLTKISRAAWYLQWIPSKLHPVTNSEIEWQKFDVSMHGYICCDLFLNLQTLLAIDCHLHLPDLVMDKTLTPSA